MNVTGDIILVAGIFLSLLMGGMWIPFAVSITATVYLYLVGGIASFNAFGLISWGSMDSFTLTAIPLFILMAELMLESGLSHRVYRGLARVVQRLPGGLLQTNIAGCAVFAAISGSSVATAAAIGAVALPQLKERGYNRRLAVGTLAAGGTLGILIPPSIALIIYGTFTQTSISKLFMAGLIPGLALAALYMVYVGFHALLNRNAAPAENMQGASSDWIGVINDLLPFALLIGLVMGSLYFGFVTPTEAAAFGCCLAALVCFLWGHLNMCVIRRALAKTVRINGAILFIVYSAFLFSYAVGMAGLADEITDAITGWGLGRIGFLAVIVVMYTILGCLVDSIGMMVITVPLLLPLLQSYHIDLIWFGVALVLLIELGQITPPLGLNLFVVQSISEGTLGDVIKGAIPFCLLIYVMLALLVTFPQLALWLPAHMFGY